MTRDPDPPNFALHSITPDCLNLNRIPPFSYHRQDGFRVEIRWSDVRYPLNRVSCVELRTSADNCRLFQLQPLPGRRFSRGSPVSQGRPPSRC
jgi:hypothetical protein